jgi:hypothetical protein
MMVWRVLTCSRLFNLSHRFSLTKLGRQKNGGQKMIRKRIKFAMIPHGGMFAVYSIPSL